jgi:hypothetical protein
MRSDITVTILGIVAALTISTAAAFADGVMRPIAAGYPKDFLRHRMTNVEVTFYGQIALTTVNQEFVNEWDDTTDALYSFPLPAEARATEFLFWSNDTLFRAPLKVKEQAAGPGAGEGGIAALLTNYLGSNALRVRLNAISPGRTQRIVLKYISFCRYDKGTISYRYPLDTDIFLTYPLDELSFVFRINATDNITAIDAGTLGSPQIVQTDVRHASVTLHKAKTYLTSDLTFSYTAASDTLSHDFYASKTAQRGGHFVFVLKSKSLTDTSAALPKDVVFMIDRSSSASGSPLELGRDAIKDCIDRLRAQDRFNVIAFDYSALSFRVHSVPATVSARDSAKLFLNALTATGYANLNSSLQTALASFTADSMNKAVILFSDGMSYVLPNAVKGWNTADAAIFPVAISLSPGRARLDAIAYANFGFPMYLLPTDPVVSEVRWLFDQMNAPIMKDTRMEMGPNAYDLFPRELHTVYAGSRFFVTGRYTTAATSGFTVAGQSSSGPTVYSAFLQFPADSTEASFAEKFWAKEKIDALERQISLYGATDSLKQLLTSISLSYGIRCMYTAYVAEKTIPVADVAECGATLASFAAEETAEGIALTWTLASGTGVREIHVCRSDRADGEYVRINPEALHGTRFLDGNGQGSRDWYRLEILTMSGERIFSEPISVRGGVIPLHVKLQQNYPNPFNPKTVISCQVPTASTVRLVVYDVLGREVATLIDERKAAGTYRVEFDGTNLSSGVYICRMTVEEPSTGSGRSFVECRKMVLMK